MWQVLNVTTQPLTGKRTISATLPAPADGRWVAFFIEVKFLNKKPAFFTSGDLLDERANNMGTKTKALSSSTLPDAIKTAIAEHYNGGLFPRDFGQFFDFTTEVSVWPNTFPYEDCKGDSCGSRLL